MPTFGHGTTGGGGTAAEREETRDDEPRVARGSTVNGGPKGLQVFVERACARAASGSDILLPSGPSPSILFLRRGVRETPRHFALRSKNPHRLPRHEPPDLYFGNSNNIDIETRLGLPTITFLFDGTIHARTYTYINYIFRSKYIK